MQRIPAIEGLRGWLAWTVVFYHVVQTTGLNRGTSWGKMTGFAATEAVYLFMIISGFVITGLVMARHESWPRFIVRRGFRLFPVYLVALAAGAFTMYLARDAIAYMPWRDLPTFTYGDHARATIQSVEAAPRAHALLHLTLFQGLVGDDVLPQSQTSLLGPAWSLSLEWQFYLIAPALIWMLLRPRWRIVAVGAIIAGALAYRFGLLGQFSLPSTLPASAYYFLIGIASWFAYQRMRDGPPLPFAALVTCIGLALLFKAALAIFAWAGFLIFLTNERHWRYGLVGVSARWLRAMFESPIARAIGARSYGIYLIHWPVLQLMLFCILPLHPFTQFQAVGMLLLAVCPLTLLAADILHRTIEQPMIRLGSRIASTMKSAPLPAPAPARTP